MKWFRLWHDMIDNPKIQSLPNKLFKAYINTLCIASANEPRGSIPDLTKYAFKLRMKPAEAQKILEELENSRLIFSENSKFFIHDWDEHQKNSDNNAVRVQRHREKCNVTGSVTETENVTETPLNNRYTDKDREEKRKEKDKTHSTRPAKAERGNACKTDGFDQAWAIYPKRMGSNPKDSALKAWKARIKEGHTLDELMAGTQRYRKNCEELSTINTQYVMQAQRFFGVNKEFLNDWTTSAIPTQGHINGTKVTRNSIDNSMQIIADFRASELAKQQAAAQSFAGQSPQDIPGEWVLINE